jgi:hypothetical protein
MPDLDYLRIIKWILIVLLAGFIGQFGKSFAKHLMERSRLKRNERAAKIDITTSAASQNNSHETHRAVEPPPVMPPEEKAKQDKKLAKALAKQKKKETKALKKQSDS